MITNEDLFIQYKRNKKLFSSSGNEYSLIQKAIAEGGRKNVYFLLKMGHSMSLSDINGDTISSFGEETPMLLSCLTGNINKAIKFVGKNKKIVYKSNSLGFTPLHWALIGGNENAVKFLLENNATIDAKNNKNETPLHWAARLGNLELIKLLLYKGAIKNINDKNIHGFTPLHWASALGHLKVVELLLKFGAKADIKNNYGASSLHWAAYDTELNDADKDKKNRIVRLLIEALKRDEPVKLKNELNFYNFMGYSPVHWSVISKNSQLFKFFLHNGGNPFDSARTQESPMQLAETLIIKKQDRNLEIILEYGSKF